MAAKRVTKAQYLKLEKKFNLLKKRLSNAKEEISDVRDTMINRMHMYIKEQLTLKDLVQAYKEEQTKLLTELNTLRDVIKEKDSSIVLLQEELSTLKSNIGTNPIKSVAFVRNGTYAAIIAHPIPNTFDSTCRVLISYVGSDPYEYAYTIATKYATPEKLQEDLVSQVKAYEKKLSGTAKNTIDLVDNNRTHVSLFS